MDRALINNNYCVEDCLRFDVQRELFRTKRVRFDAVTEGDWSGLRWRAILSDRGSYLEMSGRRWELVPWASTSRVNGVRWYVRGSDGKLVTSLFVTPDGRVGTRWEQGLKYRSQRLWTKKRLAWARAKVIQRLAGPMDFEWVRDHPDYLPRKPKCMKQARYRKLRKKLVMQLSPSEGGEKLGSHLTLYAR
jgi:hypothetical protein